MLMWVGQKGTIFPFGTFILVVRVSPSGLSAQLTVILLTEAPAEIFGLGSWKPYLWNIILAPISHPTGIFFLPLCISSTYGSVWNTVSVQ